MLISRACNNRVILFPSPRQRSAGRGLGRGVLAHSQCERKSISIWKTQHHLSLQSLSENGNGHCGASFVFNLRCSLLTGPLGACSSLAPRLNPKSVAAASIIRQALALSPNVIGGEGGKSAGFAEAFQAEKRSSKGQVPSNMQPSRTSRPSLSKVIALYQIDITLGAVPH